MNSTGKQRPNIKKRAELLPVLKSEFNKKGHLDRDVLTRVAKRMNLTIGEVYSVATFYSYLPVSKKAKNIIRICGCVPCELKNNAEIISILEKEIGILPGETTADGRFSVEVAGCLGACEQAPVMMINSEFFGDLNPQKIARILKSYLT
ncbi:MAG: NAD(P)H-dependent oxidoreductase subunit E [Dehalococcoidia bacterium]